MARLKSNETLVPQLHREAETNGALIFSTRLPSDANVSPHALSSSSGFDKTARRTRDIGILNTERRQHLKSFYCRPVWVSSRKQFALNRTRMYRHPIFDYYVFINDSVTSKIDHQVICYLTGSTLSSSTSFWELTVEFNLVNVRHQGGVSQRC